MTIRADLLEPSKVPPISKDIDLGETNRILKSLLAELRKDIAKQRTVIHVADGPVAATGALGCGFNLPARVVFFNQGNPVKSLYTIIVNACTSALMLSINEPVFHQGVAGVGTGITIAAGGPPLILPNVEIQSLSLLLETDVAVIPINSMPDPAAVLGAIWIYGWTLPEYANITE